MKYSDFDEFDALFENHYSPHRRQEKKTSVSQLNIDICRPIHK